MPSSSNNRALKRRRPSRRQPLRRCRRFQGNPGGGPFLTDIMEPVLMHILEFTMWEDEEDEMKRCLALWKWTGELGIVCQDFRRVARKVAPEKLHLNLLVDPRAVSLLEAFLDAPWKRESLIEFQCTAYNSISEPGREVIVRLFETPASLPNLTKLSVSVVGHHSEDDERAINAEFLNNLARSCPLLSNLELHLPDNASITPGELGNFGQLLQQPLNKCYLGGDCITNGHLDAFLRQQGQSLTHFEIKSRHISDLRAMASQCSQLEMLGLSISSITDGGLSSFLQANGGLRELNLCYCRLLTAEVIDGLNQHSPQLERISVFGCRWFTDECLDRLVQGQLDYWAGQRESIPLSHIDGSYTGASRAGIDRVLAKSNVGKLEVKFFDRATRAIVVLANQSESQ